MGERSFAEDVKQLGYGAGDILRGEGILAITKALLQSGVSYVGGYPGSPISHLLDVLADANESLLKPMGIYLRAVGQRGGGGGPAGRLDQLPDARGRHLEVGGRHQRRFRRPLPRGLGRGEGRLAHRHRRGLRRGRLDLAGAHARRRPEVVGTPARSPQQPGVVRPLRRGGVRPLGGVQRAGALLHPHPGLPHAGHARVQGQRPPPDQHADTARRPVVQPGAHQPAAVHLRDGGPEVHRAVAGGPALHRRAPSQRAPAGDGVPGRHRDAGRAVEHRGSRPRGAGAGRRPRAEPDPHARPQRPAPAGARGAAGLPARQDARAGGGGGHAQLHRARAEGACPRRPARRRDPRQGAAVAPRRVRARPGHRRPAQVPDDRPAPRDLAHRDRGSLRRSDRPHRAGAGGPAPADRQAAALVLYRLPRAAGVQRDEDPPHQGPGHRRHPRGGRHRMHHLLDPGPVQRRQLRAGVRHGAGVGGRGGPATSASAWSR